MKYLNKFERLVLSTAQVPEFPLDLLTPGKESEQTVFLVKDENNINIHQTSECFVIIPMFSLKKKSLEDIAKNLVTSAMNHPKYKLSDRRKRTFILLERGDKVGLAIL
jgi:hypothetical protein